MKVIASCLIVVLLFTSSGWSQSAAGESQSAASPGGHVRVTLREPTGEVKGFIRSIRYDGFDVTRAKTGEVVAVPYSNVEKVHGPGISTGWKVAIGVSVGVLAVVIVAVLVWRAKPAGF